MKLSASELLFAVHEEDPLMVVVVSKPFWDTHGCLNDMGAPEEVADYWPSDLEMFEEAESVFEIQEDFTADEVRDKLIAAGFTFSNDLKDFMEF